MLHDSEVTLRDINLRDPESLKKIEIQSEIIKSSETSLEEVKRTARELSIHTAAESDPGNSVKTSQYRICEKYEKLEEQLSSLKASVSQLTTSSEEEVSSGETVKNTLEESDSDDITDSESKSGWRKIKRKEIFHDFFYRHSLPGSSGKFLDDVLFYGGS